MLTVHPDIQSLREREQECQRELHAILHQLFVLEHDTFREISLQYNTYFRDREVALQTWTLEAAEMQRRVELFVIRTRHGAQPDEREIALVNEMVDREFRVYRQREKESFEMSAEQRNAKASSTMMHEIGRNADERRRLYRDLVKQLHPDVQPTQQQFNSFWNLVSDAYVREDLGRLRLIHNLVCETQSLNVLANPESDMQALQDHVRRLEMRLDYEKRKYQRIQTQEPYSLASMLSNEVARATHGANLDSQIAKQRRIVDAARAQLNALLGENWEEFRQNDSQTKEAFDFQDDFIQNTYFSMRA